MVDVEDFNNEPNSDTVLEFLLQADSGSDIEIDLSMDFSCLLQDDGTRKKVDIPPEVYKAFREARDDLNEEARHMLNISLACATLT